MTQLIINGQAVYTTRMAATYLGLSVAALRYHVIGYHGKSDIEPIKSGGRLYFTRASLDALRASGHIRKARTP